MACRVEEIVAIMERIAPPTFAEEWDNVGLQVGSLKREVAAVLFSLDVTREVLAEAHGVGAGLVICHHPLFFRPLYRLIADEPVGALLEEAVISGFSIYAAHTNLDISEVGVNVALAEKLGLHDHRPLRMAPDSGGFKLVTFLPPQEVAAVGEALFSAGAGIIGDYSGCSFRVEGTGTFTPGESSNPAYGERGKPNQLREVRLEIVVAEDKLQDVLESLRNSHPYEEPAYDIYYLSTPASGGMGRVGDLPQPTRLDDLARFCSSELGNASVRFTGDPGHLVKRVAVCGGSGASLAPQAAEAGAQALITGDVGYHQAVEALAGGLAIIDAGHYHTERPVIPRLASLLSEKAADLGLEVEVFASQVHTCPWNYGGLK